MSDCIFGVAAVTAEQLFQELRLGIPREWRGACARLGLRPDCDSRAAWTLATNRTLCRLAAEYQYQPQCREARGEWASLDMIWWLTGYTAMALAAESEWIIDKGKILDDFQKLMFLKSPLKLFIYQTRSAEQSREFREAIENEMRAFVQHVKGEHYVLFEVAAGNAAHGYRYTAPITGETQSVRFEEIMGSPMSFEWETQNT